MNSANTKTPTWCRRFFCFAVSLAGYFVFLIVARFRVPVAANLLCPIAISLPRIQGGINANPPPSRRRSFWDPLTILLPTVCIVRGRLCIVRCRLCSSHCLSLVCRRICFRCVSVSPLEIFAVWHCLAPFNPLHKCYAANDANHRNCITIDYVTFHIIFRYLSAVLLNQPRRRQRRHWRFNNKIRSGHAVTGLVIATGNLHALLGDERCEQLVQQAHDPG